MVAALEKGDNWEALAIADDKAALAGAQAAQVPAGGSAAS
jgi:hypothetical protein